MSLSHLAWPFFDEAHGKLTRDLDDWARANVEETHGDVDAECRALVRGARRSGLASPCGRRPRLWRRERSDRHARDLPHPRDPGAPVRPRRFRLRDAGPGLRRDQHRRLAKPRSVAISRSSRAAKRLPPSRFPSPKPARMWRRCACAARAEGDAYVLDGEKTWISNGGIADVYVVFARTGEAPGARGISAFIVEATTPGFEIAERIEVDRAASAGPAALFAVAASPPRRASAAGGEGFKIAMRTLDVFRTSVAAAALGLARRALDEAPGAGDDPQDVRRRARRLPVDAGQARRNGDDDRRRGAADLPRRLDARSRPLGHARSRDGEDGGDRGRAARHRRGDADLGRHGRRHRRRRSSGSTAKSARCGSTRARPKCSSSSSGAISCATPTAGRRRGDETRSHLQRACRHLRARQSAAARTAAGLYFRTARAQIPAAAQLRGPIARSQHRSKDAALGPAFARRA